MSSWDVKKERPALYAPRSRDVHEVVVPEARFLAADGHGDPNTSTDYADAVTALFTLSYAARAVAKEELGRVHMVGPLEGLWAANDPGAFVRREKASWNWTMMVTQPAWISADVLEAARTRAHRRGRANLDRVRMRTFTEGQCVQVLHVGSYDDEGPVLHRLHHSYLPEHGLTFDGAHHEIYLSDPRRTEPARLRTILRQRVRPIG